MTAEDDIQMDWDCITCGEELQSGFHCLKCHEKSKIEYAKQEKIKLLEKILKDSPSLVDEYTDWGTFKRKIKKELKTLEDG